MKTTIFFCVALLLLIISGCEDATDDEVIVKARQRSSSPQVMETVEVSQDTGDDDAEEEQTVIATSPSNSLDSVDSWFYYIGFEPDRVIDNIVDSGYDLVVIEPVFTEKENLDYDIEKIVQEIKYSDKLVIAYIDIGEAESYRYYWGDDWEVGDPEWIAGEDPDMWEDNYPVAFWRQEWQDIWFGNDGQFQMLIDVGFDGFYLDWVEAYSDENVMKLADKDDVDAEDEMVKFIKKIHAFCSTNDCYVIAQNAAELAERSDYPNYIDAIAQEQTWFDGSAVGEPEGDCPLPEYYDDIETADYVNSLSSGCRKMHDTLTESTLHMSSEEYLEYLTTAKDKGLTIFTVDYALEEDNIDWVYKTSRSYGFIPFVSNRPLDLWVEPR